MLNRRHSLLPSGDFLFHFFSFFFFPHKLVLFVGLFFSSFSPLLIMSIYFFFLKLKTEKERIELWYV